MSDAEPPSSVEVRSVEANSNPIAAKTDLISGDVTESVPETSGARKRKGIPRWLRWSVSLGLLAWLFSSAKAGEAFSAMAAADPRWLIAAMAVMFGLSIYAAMKWWLLMPRGSAGPLTFVRVYFVSNFVGMFLPGIVGIEVARVAGLSHSTSDPAASVSSVMVDRLFGLMSLIGLVLIGVWFTSVEVPAFVTLWSGLLLAGMGMFMVAMMSRRIRTFTSSLLPSLIAAKIDKVYACLDLYRTRKGILLLSAALACGFQLCRVLLFYTLIRALGIVEVPFGFLIVVVPVAMFVQMLPISIFGLGVREAVIVGLLAQVGVPAESALALSLLAFSVQILGVLPGAFFLGGKGGKNDQGASAAASEGDVSGNRSSRDEDPLDLSEPQARFGGPANPSEIAA